LDFFLFVAAVVGHGYLLTIALNVLYSRPLHKTFLKAHRLLTAMLIVGGPLAYLLGVGFVVPHVLDGVRRVAADAWLAGYITFVLAIAFVVLPLVTIARLMRRDPSITTTESRVVDFERKLGYRPIGDGKHARLASRRWNDLFRVEFSTLTLRLPELPAEWDGLTILHLSDLHFYGAPGREYFDAVIAAAMDEGVPDLVAITGDIVDHRRYLPWIHDVLRPLRWNIAGFAILGNHDWWQDFNAVRRELQGVGLSVVSNRWERLVVRGRPLTVIGHEGPWFRPAPDLADCPPGDFRLLLSHTPDNIRWAKRNHVRLMLSGHNHGGQIRLPIAGSIFCPSLYSRRYDMGTFFESPTLLHVNRGLSGKEPIRFRCLPQVTRIILQREANPEMAASTSV
jgi:hypothetical protein